MEHALRKVRTALSDMASAPAGASAAAAAAASSRAGPRIGRCEAVCITSHAHHACYADQLRRGDYAVPDAQAKPGTGSGSAPEVALVFPSTGGGDGNGNTFRATAYLDADATSKSEMFDATGRKALDWVLAGYNVNLVTTGHAGSGKSSTLFGQSGRHGQVHILLNELYKHIEEHGGDVGGGNGGGGGGGDASGSDGDGGDPQPQFTVGLSMWELAKDRVTDLLSPAGRGGSGRGAAGAAAPSEEATSDHLLKFVNVRCESFSTIVALLAVGMARSANFCESRGQELLVRPNRAHLFLRVAVHNARSGNLSILHVLDLIGDVPVAGGVPQEPTGSGPEAERDYYSSDPEFSRFSLQQATSFAQMVAELADASLSTGETGLGALSSYQSSALNRLLAPVLSGNAKTLVLEHVSPHRFFQPDSLRTLGVGQRALNIHTICRQLAVPLNDMRFLDSSVALGAKPQPQQQPNAGTAAAATDTATAAPAGSGGSDGDGDGDGGDSDESNGELMQALYASPGTNQADAELRPLAESPRLSRAQREALGIFVGHDDDDDDDDNDDNDDDGDDNGGGGAGEEDGNGTGDASENDAAGSSQPREGGGGGGGGGGGAAPAPAAKASHGDSGGGPGADPWFDPDVAAAQASAAVADDVQARIANIDSLLSEIQSSQQSYSAKKNRLRDEINAVVDDIVGGGGGSGEAVGDGEANPIARAAAVSDGAAAGPGGRPVDPAAPFASTRQHARSRQLEADAQARAEQAWRRQQQELELAAAVARDASFGGVHSIPPPVVGGGSPRSVSLAGPRMDPSTGSAGWGASPPPHLRPHLHSSKGSSGGRSPLASPRAMRPATTAGSRWGDAEDVSGAAADGAVAAVYERQMENLARAQQRQRRQQEPRPAREAANRAREAPPGITMDDSTRGHWGNQVVMPDGFLGAVTASSAMPGVGLSDAAAAGNAAALEAAAAEAEAAGEVPVRGAAYYASLIEKQRRALGEQQRREHYNGGGGGGGRSRPLASSDGAEADAELSTDAGAPNGDSDGSGDSGGGGQRQLSTADYFRQKIAAHVRENEAAEAAAEYELLIAELRGDNLKLRSELRSIKQASGFADVFKRFEGDLDAARQDVADLRKRNARLETAVDAQIVKDAVASNNGHKPRRGKSAVGTSGGGGEGPVSKKLKTRLRNLRAEVLTLREQLAGWELKDRTFALHKRCLEDATRKARHLARRAEGAESESSAAKAANAALREEVVQLRARCGALEQDRRMATFESRKSSLEVQRLRQVVDDMAHARNRAAQVDGVSAAIKGNPYRATASFRNQSDLPEEVRACFQRLDRSVSRGCPRSLHTLALLKEHVEKMRADVRGAVQREEQLLDLMIEFVQRGERKNDIQCV